MNIELSNAELQIKLRSYRQNVTPWCSAAFALSLATHAFLAFLLSTIPANKPAPENLKPVMIDLMRQPQAPAAPVPPKPKPPPSRQHLVKPHAQVMPHAVPQETIPVKAPDDQPRLATPVVPRITTPPHAAPPAHSFTSNADDWVIPSQTEGSGNGARRVPIDYADKVKAGITGNMYYPPDAVYVAPRGFRGDRRVLIRQCTIPYEIVIDRNGRMISHRIEPCDDNLLDAAAEAALLKAGPFPPPPDMGAEQYVIYGSANFRVNFSNKGISVSGGK
jgi:protein TonB